MKKDVAHTNIVLATGCQNSGWKNAIPIFRQLGFDEADDAFSKWNDDLFHAASTMAQFQFNQPFQPSHSQIERAAELLSGEPGSPLLWADARSLWLLDFWAANFPKIKFLLLYTRAESALAFALQQDVDPEQFMQTWQTTSQHLMSFQRRNRRCSLLLDAEAVVRYPKALVETCQRIGIELQPENLSEAAAMTVPAIERLLAKQYLREQPTIQTLQMELEANAQPLGDTEEDTPLRLTELYQGYQQWHTQTKQLGKALEKQAADDQAQRHQAREKLEAANRENEQENELLLLQLHQVQEELEAVFLQKQDIASAQKERDTQLEQLRQKLDKTEKVFRAAEIARKTLVSDQQKFQAQIERLTQTNNEQSKLAEERQGQIQKLSKERDEQAKLVVEQQSQFGQAKKVQEKLEAARKETEQENELLLLQLHQAQEELETIFLQKQHIELAQKNGDTQREQLRQKLDKTEKVFQVAETARKTLVSDQQKFQAQIERLTQTNNEQSKLVEERQGQIQKLSKERDDQAKLVVEQQSQFGQAKKVQEKLEAARKETEQENELLLLQLHQVQEELEAVFLKKQHIESAQKNDDTQREQLRQKLDKTEKAFQAAETARKSLVSEQQKNQAQIERLTQTSNEHSTLVEERQNQIQALSKERDEQSKLAAERQSQFVQAKQVKEKLEAAGKEIKQENELLLLQLHQVQEELELYFLKYQELSKGAEKKQEAVDALAAPKEQKDSVEGYSSVPQKNKSTIRFLIKSFRPTSKQKKREKKQVRLIAATGLFDQAWYLAEYPDVAEENIGPIEHYLRFGAAEGRNPSPQFDTVYYLATNPDLSVAETNPLVHYIQFGREEGRAPSSKANTK